MLNAGQKKHWLPSAATVLFMLGSCNLAAAQNDAPVATLPAPAQPASIPAPQLPALPAVAAPSQKIVLDGIAAQGRLLTGTAPTDIISLALDGMAVPIAPDGRFIIGLDRDSPAKMTLSARFADNRIEAVDLAVAPGNWRIEQVNASPTGAASSAEFQARRQAELQRINAARAIPVQSEGWQQRFIWPVAGRISGLFGAQRVYRGQPGSYHSGLDIAGGAGTIYVAPANGVVTLASDEPCSLEGKLLLIDHGMGLSSAFLHSSELLVKTGDVVKQGQPIGRIGATGRASGPHLHWGMRWQAARIDPLPLLPPR